MVLEKNRNWNNIYSLKVPTKFKKNKKECGDNLKNDIEWIDLYIKDFGNSQNQKKSFYEKVLRHFYVPIQESEDFSSSKKEKLTCCVMLKYLKKYYKLENVVDALYKLPENRPKLTEENKEKQMKYFEKKVASIDFENSYEVSSLLAILIGYYDELMINGKDGKNIEYIKEISKKYCAKYISKSNYKECKSMILIGRTMQKYFNKNDEINRIISITISFFNNIEEKKVSIKSKEKKNIRE